MPFIKILERTLDGGNSIVEIDSSWSGPKTLNDFLQSLGMNTFEGIAELAQVLKVPIDDLRDCAEKGFVNDYAAENIIEYWRNCRIHQNGISFLQRQHGESGNKNVDVPSDLLDFKDNCG